MNVAKDNELLKNEEKAIFALRALWREYGYLPFKMSKFEEYDLYLRNRDFLVSDSVITFNDTNGALLALKPDVTLSIIKNSTDAEGCKQKVYYNENVYRVSGSTRRFKEIMQTGLECIGDIDNYDIFEVLYLSAKSLDTISHDFALDVSHMAIFKALLDEATSDEVTKRELIGLISQKNKHEARARLMESGASESATESLLALIDLYGAPSVVLPKLEALCVSPEAKEAFDSLRTILTLLSETEYKDKVKVDFSVINDMNYYNGIVFKGFINTIPEGVLAGGQYDALMERMGRHSGAIGFAIYLDLIEGFGVEKGGYDVDVLLLYSDKTPMGKVCDRVRTLTEASISVSAQKSIPQKLRYKMLENLDGEGR